MDQLSEPQPSPLRAVVPATVKADEAARVEEQDRTVDEAGEESFPASDPPGWTPAVAGPVAR